MPQRREGLPHWREGCDNINNNRPQAASLDCTPPRAARFQVFHVNGASASDGNASSGSGTDRYQAVAGGHAGDPDGGPRLRKVYENVWRQRCYASNRAEQ